MVKSGYKLHVCVIMMLTSNPYFPGGNVHSVIGCKNTGRKGRGKAAQVLANAIRSRATKMGNVVYEELNRYLHVNHDCITQTRLCNILIKRHDVGPFKKTPVCN